MLHFSVVVSAVVSEEEGSGFSVGLWNIVYMSSLCLHMNAPVSKDMHSSTFVLLLHLNTKFHELGTGIQISRTCIYSVEHY